jgi:peroxiredoxin Q/BCP
MRFSRAMISLATSLVIGVPLLAAQGNEGKVKAVLQSGPDVGRRAPDFSLPWASKDSVGPIESPYQLASDRGKTVVIAFYPGDFTQSSTAEMRTLAQQYDSLAGPDVVLVAISRDSVFTHRRFAQSLNLPFRLLSDPDQRISKQYASKDPNGYNRRTVYVVGSDGRVAFRNLQFNALDPKDYAELRNAVKNSLRRS